MQQLLTELLDLHCALQSVFCCGIPLAVLTPVKVINNAMIMQPVRHLEGQRP